MWRKCRQYKGTERFTSRVEGRGTVRQYKGTEGFTNRVEGIEGRLDSTEGQRDLQIAVPLGVFLT